jgi:alkylation response protein AidB-like acyl-CoA dehydrogenase
LSVRELPASTSSAGSVAADRLDRALSNISRRAVALDRDPRFPSEDFADLAAAGAMSPAHGCLAAELRLVRAVAAANASTARILDGHINGVERVSLCAPEPLRSEELDRVREGELLLGVWGADPAPGEGQPAQLSSRGGQPVLSGVKTFCSGAGGVHRALVVAGDSDGARRLVYVDAMDVGRVSVDRGWYRASGLRTSESHRVEFHDSPVLALLGESGELSREPYFCRDAIRTSATWAGLADRILAEATAALGAGRADATQAHSLGRMRVARSTIDRWLDHAVARLDGATSSDADPTALALECRVALADAARQISGLAARACGSRALIGASAMDRARRDLDLFLLQHRLDPKLTQLGEATLAESLP